MSAQPQIVMQAKGDLKQMMKDPNVLKAASDFRAASEQLDAIVGGKRYTRAAAQDIGKTAAYFARLKPAPPPTKEDKERELRFARLLFPTGPTEERKAKAVFDIETEQYVEKAVEKLGGTYIPRSS